MSQGLTRETESMASVLSEVEEQAEFRKRG